VADAPAGAHGNLTFQFLLQMGGGRLDHGKKLAYKQTDGREFARLLFPIIWSAWRNLNDSGRDSGFLAPAPSANCVIQATWLAIYPCVSATTPMVSPITPWRT